MLLLLHWTLTAVGPPTHLFSLIRVVIGGTEATEMSLARCILLSNMLVCKVMDSRSCLKRCYAAHARKLTRRLLPLCLLFALWCDRDVLTGSRHCGHARTRARLEAPSRRRSLRTMDVSFKRLYCINSSSTFPDLQDGRSMLPEEELL